MNALRKDPSIAIARAANARSSSSSLPKHNPYMPPFTRLLHVLGITQADLTNERTSVSTAGIMALLKEYLKNSLVEESWYVETYPDVYAAILAGRTSSAAAHFRAAGYREGRLPRKLPFDAGFYYTHYKDLATAFQANDVEGLQRHYETRGYFEGRAGISDHCAEADHWRNGMGQGYHDSEEVI